MRDHFQGDVVHARAPRRGTMSQARQFKAVTPGKVPLGRTDLFFDEIEIVEQPLSCRGDAAFCRNRLRQQVTNPGQGHLVFCQPGQ